MKKLTIAIAGMGLIGGSLGLAIKKRTAHTVIGIDCDKGVLDAVLQKGAADKTGAEHLPKAGLLILALSPADCLRFLESHVKLLSPGTIVTDVCGVKREAVKTLAPICKEHRLTFVGGHPMAGREKSGFAHADPDLFEGAYYILTPESPAPDRATKNAIGILKELALSIGCKGVTIATPEQHDRIIAFTSQLPHVLAGAYVKSPQCPEHHGFSAGSYRDVSRVATVDERLWAQLFIFNSDNICAEIDTLIANLKACRDAIALRDYERLEQILREGRLRKESVAD
ncbi:MAG TPA: prephenate dehydrogenase/arogenate dehydrogenase family protein [Candidatus Avimonas sp.]|jgi:prephenate dehydrogenase|nr:prephenate dehydrogenase/arogenate dehydrogenase family protein [Candidatus Avimonas sp.]